MTEGAEYMGEEGPRVLEIYLQEAAVMTYRTRLSAET